MTEKPDMKRLMGGVIPYVIVSDARAAIDFYAKAFGAISHGPPTVMDDGRVANAGLEINGGMMMLMDPFPETGSITEGHLAHGFTCQLVVLDGAFWWDRAVAAGCTITMPFEEQFWGDTYGRLSDPFGLEWAINQPANPEAPF